MEWDNSTEQMLERFCDEAACRENLHRESFYFYKRWSNVLSLPVVCLSALSGSLQFLSQSYAGWEKTIITVTGSVSVLVSIISAVSNYLKLETSKAVHEHATNNWLNLYTEIRSQLLLRRDFRADCAEFLRQILERRNHLFELSPIVKSQFIRKVRKSLKKVKNFHTPTYLNGHTPTKAYIENANDEYSDNTV